MKNLLLTLLILTSITATAQQPYLSIDYDRTNNAVGLDIVIPPTTNEFWLQVSTNLTNWDSVQPRLDSFPDQWVTNQFAILNPGGISPLYFFRASSDSNSVTSAQSMLVEQKSSTYYHPWIYIRKTLKEDLELITPKRKN